jgi:hypothetical protein
MSDQSISNRIPDTFLLAARTLAAMTSAAAAWTLQI